MTVLVLALALAMLLFTATVGADPADRPPRLLPPDMETLARPMESVDPVAGAQTTTDATAYQQMMQLMQAVELLRQGGDAKVALDAWRTVSLAGEAEVWRHVVLGALHLRAGEVDEAAAALTTAQVVEPGNPVAHYLMGVVRLQQAVQVHGSPLDTPSKQLLVYYSSGSSATLSPPTKCAEYRAAAARELTAAVESTAELDMSNHLAPWEMVTPPPHEMTMPLVSPTVADALESLDLLNYRGNSHYLLGRLKMARGELTSAETHFDAARKTQLPMGGSFESLGDKYNANSAYRDAARAYLKSASGQAEWTRPTLKAMECLRKALWNVDS
jgi:tetratricopeptide (TPR) repeat protein